MFPKIGFLAWQILGVIGFQIEIESKYSNLKRCHLQTENLEKLIFVNKNWPNDLKIGCKSSSSLLEFLERDVDLKKE
jgi:hypothetical protein